MIKSRLASLRGDTDGPLWLTTVALALSLAVGAIAVGLTLKVILDDYWNMAIFLVGAAGFIMWAITRIAGNLASGDGIAPNALALVAFAVGTVAPLLGSDALSTAGHPSWTMFLWVIAVGLFLWDMDKPRRSKGRAASV